jgi:phenylacetate-coenzyme A ligase PaaK-like adenylate-forming protein
MHLAEKAQEMGIDLKEMPLRVGVFGAEPWTDAMRARIEADTGIRAFDIYGLSEIIGPGVASECASRTACTCSRTTSTRRSSTRKPASPCRTARRANWC